MGNEDETFTLSGQQAIKLWQQGKDAWNLWAKNHPKANVDFSNTDFFKLRKSQRTAINFGGFCFPTHGWVSFVGAHFGRGDVHFLNAQFGNGNVTFESAQFRNGNIDFSDAKFDDGDVNFSYAKFSDAHVDFSNAEFNNRNVNFSYAKFDNGYVNFSEAKFNNRNVDFSYVKLNNAHMDFLKAKFNNRNVDFSYAKLGDGNIYFMDARFNNSNVYFIAAQLTNGNIDFTDARFNCTSVSFEKTKFIGHANFDKLVISDKVKSIDFRFASFNSSMLFSTLNKIHCIPDFTGTKTTHHFILSGLEYQLQTKGWGVWRKAEDPNDADKLCRLKEIAEDNKDHNKALQFYADEMRARRWQKKTKLGENLLDLLFSGFSNYGQSILRPTGCLIFIWLVFFFYLLTNCGTTFDVTVWPWNWEGDNIQIFKNSITLTASKTIPFLGGIIMDANKARDGITLPDWYEFWGIWYSMVAFIFLFLIGLGLRNRFRL